MRIIEKGCDKLSLRRKDRATLESAPSRCCGSVGMGQVLNALALSHAAGSKRANSGGTGAAPAVDSSDSRF